MIGYYNYTVILTYIGTVFGFIGITYIGDGHLKTALICLMVCGFCDMFDGRVASTMERTRSEKRFGIQIDSLSDLICFGVLPALIVLQCAGRKTLNITICAMYMLCALIRLAWFNVDEEERQTQQDGHREAYLGLPVTTSALLLPLAFGICESLSLHMQMLAPWFLFALAIAFILPFKLKNPGLAGKLALLVLGVGCFVLVMIGVPA